MDIKEKIYQTLKVGNPDLFQLVGSRIFYRMTPDNLRENHITISVMVTNTLKELTGEIYAKELSISINIFSPDLETLYIIADLVNPLLLIELNFDLGDQSEITYDDDTKLYHLEMQYNTTE